MHWIPLYQLHLIDFVVYVLACIGAHRLWNYESVFEKTREWLQAISDEHGKILTFLTCPMCNAFWIALLLAVMFSLSDTMICFLPFAAYPLIRSVIWWYAQGWRFLPDGARAANLSPYIPPPPRVLPAPAGEAAPAGKASTSEYSPSTEPVITLAGSCNSCDLTEINKIGDSAKAYERRIVLLTSLGDFHPSFSLTACILAQARMLAENPRWIVLIWVNENCSMTLAPADIPSNVKIQRVFPTVAWKNGEVDVHDMNRISSRLQQLLTALSPATVISHDLLFVHDYTTAAAAIHQIGQIPGIAWLHTCHSNAGDRPAVIDDSNRWQHTVPEGHRLLCLSAGDVPYLARYYDTDPAKIVVLPNAYDASVFGQFSPRVTQLIRNYDLDTADVVQIYPISGTRMRDKGLEEVIRMFGLLHAKGLTVRLVIANPHSNGIKEAESVQAFKQYARERGLAENAVIFISDVYPDTAAYGLGKKDIHDLFSISNLFVFPSISEASSLVLFEAALSGCIMVLNSSLHTTPQALLQRATLAPFGSCRNKGEAVNYPALVGAVMKELNACQNVAKRNVLQHFSHRTVGAALRQIVAELPPVH